jgi:hypothetical protein
MLMFEVGLQVLEVGQHVKLAAAQAPFSIMKKNGGGNHVTALLVTLWDATQG